MPGSGDSKTEESEKKDGARGHPTPLLCSRVGWKQSQSPSRLGLEGAVWPGAVGQWDTRRERPSPWPGTRQAVSVQKGPCSFPVLKGCPQSQG